MSIGDVWQRVFEQVIDVQPVRYPILVLATGLLAAALVVWRPSWRVLRGVETIVHEGGHAAAAALTGRRLHGVRLHPDTSGLTVTSGRPTGPGRVFTVLAGYPASAVLGLGGVALLRAEHAAALLWASVVLLVAMLVLIRNLYGVVPVLGTGVVLIGLLWFAPSDVQTAFGYLLVWFLLLAAPRSVLEINSSRRRGGTDSDPDRLAQLTGVPAGLWIALLAALTLAAAAFGAFWLLPWQELPIA